MAKRPRIGDIIEIPLKTGFAYGQFVLNHKTQDGFGPLITVLPGIHPEKHSNPQQLVDQPEQFLAFYPLGVAVSQGFVSIVAHADVPTRFERFPLFKVYGGIDHKTRKATTWFLWDGEKSWMVDRLTPEQRKLPVKEIVGVTLLHERIEQGWRPETDLLV